MVITLGVPIFSSSTIIYDDKGEYVYFNTEITGCGVSNCCQFNLEIKDC